MTLSDRRLRLMLTHEKIVEAVKKAANEFPISRAEYFGSNADGCATEDLPHTF